MPDLKDGESAQVQGSARAPYILKNVGGVYSCTCPAWRNQSLPIERRTCKHLRAYRGEQMERQRLGSLFDAGDYPDSLAELFAIEFDFPSVEVPDYLQRLNPQLYEETSNTRVEAVPFGWCRGHVTG